MEKRSYFVREYIGGKWMYCIIFLLCLLILACVPAGLHNITPFDFVFLVIRGFSFQKFRLVEFLYYIFFYIYPLFWINYFLENEKRDRNEVAKLRFGSVQCWNYVVLKECVGYVLRYYFLYLFSVAVLDSILVTFRYDRVVAYMFAIEEYYGIHTEGICLAFGISLLWRLVELFLLLEIDLCIYQYKGNTLAAFFGTFAIYLLGAVLRKGNILIAGLGAAYGTLEIISLNRVWILIANIAVGLCLVIGLFLLQLKRSGRLQDISLWKYIPEYLLEKIETVKLQDAHWKKGTNKSEYPLGKNRNK